ncbi:MAG: peptide ABC transporter substrate-binding protein [Planctomycetota bacterium]
MRIAAPIVLLVLALLATVSLDRPLPPADLVVVERSDCYTLDPQRMSYQHELRRARVIYETLVNLRASDCTVVPGVADRWERSDDGLTWTFHLRGDAKWSNGDPVTSADFLYAWRRALLPDTAADYSGLFFEIRGGRAFFDRRTQILKDYAAAGAGGAERAQQAWSETLRAFDELVGVRAPDTRTLVVTLVRPLPFFLDFCAFPPFAPVHERTVSSFTSIDPATARVVQRHDWTKPGAIVTNGAYVPTVWRYKRDMRLTANPHYWNRAATVAGTIEFRTIENPNTGVLSFESGAADWLTDVGPEYKSEMLAERRRYLERYADELARATAAGLSQDEAVAELPAPGPGERRDTRGFDAFGTDFFSFNCRPELAGGRANPFHDAGVRRAFALAVDKQALVDRVTRLGERVTGTLVPVGSLPGYPEVEGLGFDAARARAELKAAGWEDRDDDGVVENARGERFPTVDILYSTASPRYQNLALAMRDMWKRELRVAAECRGKDSKLYKEDLKKGNFMIARGGWYGDYGDPTTWLDLQRTGNGNNDRGYSNPEYDRRLDEATAIADPAERLRALAEVERWLFTTEVPMLPLCNYVTVYGYDPTRTQGMSEHPRLEQDLSVLGTPAQRAAAKEAEDANALPSEIVP